MSPAAIWALAKGIASKWQYIVIGVLALGLLWYRGSYLECKAERADDKAAAEEAARSALELDAVNVREVQARAAAEIAVLRQEARDRDARINQAPQSRACIDSPAFRALFDAERERVRERAGGGAPASAAGR